MPNTLISVPTTLRPTAAQTLQLAELVRQANDIHLTLRRWLRLRGAGATLTLLDALRQVAAGATLPDVQDSMTFGIPEAALDELRALRVTDLPDAWSQLPSATVRAICHSNAGRFKKRRAGRAGTLLALLPLNAIPLDSGVHPLDEHRIMIDGIRTPVVADLWLQPTDIMQALLTEADEQTRLARRFVADAVERVVCGETEALSELYAGASKVGERLHLPAPRTVDRTLPHRADHVQLMVATEPAGAEVYQLGWTVRVPCRHRPPASIDDTVGIDLGVRNLATLADGLRHWHVPRQTTVRDLPAPDLDDPDQILLHAVVRRGIFELHRAALESALQRILAYRRAHLEALSYEGMRDHGRVPWAPVAMQLSGATSLTGWVQMLADVTGTRVRLVDPAGTSTSCPHPNCKRVCTPEKPFLVTTCPDHGDMDSDVVGARMTRRG
ncbi:hypothetical protein [Deinococcus hohokamensis]|uniref:Transposase n=1 Tax=Deinococcus hohokamensis TaxID=309883 RepID=A0ABV9I698_9DEIO